MTVKDRLFLFKQRFGISKAELERAANMSKASIFGSSAGKSISSDAISQILLNYPNLSAEWLMRGEGEMLKRKETPKQEPKNNNNIDLMRNKVLLYDIGEQLIKLSTTM